MQADRQTHFCRACGAPTAQRLPDDGDTKPRAVCTQCATVHYVNPLNVVGTIPVWHGSDTPQVLLCKRNIEPRKGKWTLPAGFMEMNESAAEGAARETVEEAGAQFTMGPLFSVISVTHVGQVHFFYTATLTSDQFAPGDETQEARLFTAADIPWDELAFKTVKETLALYFGHHPNAPTHAVHELVLR
jgi:ADP-ribose pyrophosphatase YjhB (NUDIX family)